MTGMYMTQLMNGKMIRKGERFLHNINVGHGDRTYTVVSNDKETIIATTESYKTYIVPDNELEISIKADQLLLCIVE